MSQRPRRILAALSGLTAVGGVSACAAGNDQQSILNPAGEHADGVYVLWLWLLGLGTAVWIAVVAILVVAVMRRRRGSEDQTAEGSDGRAAATRGRPVAAVAVAGAAVPALIITGVAAYAVIVQRDIDVSGDDARPLVEVVGHQYWWEVVYPEEGVVSANEIHLPVGERVRVDVASDDVIHSFWVPELAGKIDMIPGTSNSLWLEAREPGVYWGQCAEYCGAQHARMRFVVVAHEPAEFDAWLAHNAQAPAAADPGQDGDDESLVARGRDVFMSSSCVYCHAIDGTPAVGREGPDLTHFASRHTLAAGTRPNDAENLSAWILDPQSIKPGALMPGTDIDDPEELAALIAYLESLE